MEDANSGAVEPRLPVEGAGGGGTAANRSEPRRRGSRDPKVFVLLRELSEVHLLLDNVSANPTTTVSELSSDEGLAAQGLDSNWIEKVCEISWPPGGSNEEKAEDAALLIRAKDYLNRLSHPASGSTIAFTLLVTQEDAQQRGDGEANPSATPTRSSLAETAYPDLIGKALKFRKAMWLMSLGLVVALILTCLLSWYVAYGNAALAELAAARENLASVGASINSAEADQAAQRRGTETADEPAEGQTADPGETGQQQQPFVVFCSRTPYTSATQAQLCEQREQALASLVRVEQRLASWTCWRPFGDCHGEQIREPGTTDVPSHAASLANILGSAVLPFLYGLLGAGAAIIRSLSRKIRASLLSPRDLHLSFQQLALGAVVGACIGLFVAAPGADASGESLLGPVALSASALSFIAGFGVEAVFQGLETLITRIFNITQAPSGNRGDGIAVN